MRPACAAQSRIEYSTFCGTGVREWCSSVCTMRFKNMPSDSARCTDFWLIRKCTSALSEGMFLKRIVHTLEHHSRTPVPQNVLYSIRDWAAQAGLMHLTPDYCVRTENAELLRRFQQDPGVKPLVREVIDDQRVKLRSNATLRRTQSLLRELGYMVELEE